MDFLGSPDPSSVERVAATLSGARGQVTATEGDVLSAVSRATGSWHGSAAGAFQSHMATEESSMTALAGVVGQMVTTLDHLASELRRAVALAQQAEGLAQAHGLVIGSDGAVSSPAAGGRFALPPNPAQVQARAQVQGLVNQARTIATTARSEAAGALSGLSVPQVQPGVTPQAAALWAQQSAPGAPGSPPSFGDDLWKALRGNALPPSGLGDLGVGLWAGGRGITVLGKIASWMTTVQLGRFAPRNALGQFVSIGDMPWWQQALKSTNGKNWVALPFQGESRAAWATAGKWAGRAGGGLAIVMSGLGQFFQDSGNPNLDTTARVSRAAYRGAVAGGAAWGGAIAGAEAGGAIGSIIGPEGTVIGGAIGGIVGGVAGSGIGNWAVDHTVNVVGKGADAVTHLVGDAGSHAIHALESLNPF